LSHPNSITLSGKDWREISLAYDRRERDTEVRLNFQVLSICWQRAAGRPCWISHQCAYWLRWIFRNELFTKILTSDALLQTRKDAKSEVENRVNINLW